MILSLTLSTFDNIALASSGSHICRFKETIARQSWVLYVYAHWNKRQHI